MRAPPRPTGLALALFAVCLAACEPAADPAARDVGSADAAPEIDGGDVDAAPDPEPEADATPDPEPEADAAPDPEPEPDAAPDPEPDAGPDAAPPVECGDGRVEGDEVCDDGPDNSDEAPDACRTDCLPARCGDGVIDDGETCDGARTCDPETCQPACEDTCDLGATACDGGLVTCGDHDDDPCYEWGPPTACAEDEACVEGACVCVDTCVAETTECVGEAAVRRCAPQADGCLGWSPPDNCAEFEACGEGACAPLPPPPVLINEVLYDPPGADAAGVFIELWGPPGTPLDGLQVQGINGNGGAVVDDIALAGVIGEDGFFLLTHPNAAEPLRGLADQVDVDVDLQNGPDSVRLVRGELVVDALGYGDFADAVFAGEGQPAPDAAELSLTRDAEHGDTDDNLTDFRVAEPTPRGDPPFACDDACAADEARCVEDAVEICRAGPDGCLGWQPEQDCAADGQICADGACVPACPDPCALDARRCVEAPDHDIEVCAVGPDGCPGWQPGEACPADAPVCLLGECVCVDACVEDETRCAGDRVERCGADGPVCLEWRPADDCAADGRMCAEGACIDRPRCGDGQLDPDEACDDGNLDLGDGCDDACAVEDPFDQRAILLVRAPPPGERPDHVPADLAATSYAPGLRYDNAHYSVFEAFDDSIRDQVAQVPLGRGLRLEPGDYAVVINDTYQRVVVDWLDRVEIGAGRLEVRSPQRGSYTVRPPRRFDDIARDLPLRGCGQFGNQVRSPWIFGGCDGAIGGGAITLDTGLVVLPQTYRVSVDATYHSPNATFVEVPDGGVGIYEPADTRARIELVPTAGDLPDWQIERMPTYGTSARRVPSGNGECHIFRFIDLVEGFDYIGSGCAGGAVVVPAGRYYITLNDTYVVREVAAGETLRVPTGRIEIPGEGTFDLVPDPNVRRFTFIDNQRDCSREGPETYLLAHCFLEEPDGVFPRGSGVMVLPGTYQARIYGVDGGLLQVQPFEVADALPE